MDESNIENQINNHKEIYKVTKGFCLIINIINFDGNEEMRRDGSEENVKLIKKAFEHHGFQVNDYCDLNHDEMINLIDEQVNNEKCKSLDALVLYIHSHGIKDTILCKNNNRIHFNQITELFSDKKCQHLINKPKIIFFDCCRNGQSNYINYLKLNLIHYISEEIKMDDSMFDYFTDGFKKGIEIDYSDLIVCCSTLKG